MDGFAIGQQHNPQEPVIHLRHLHPPPDSTIGLNGFTDGRPDGLFNPRFLNDNPIRVGTDRFEIISELHGMNWRIKISDLGTYGAASTSPGNVNPVPLFSEAVGYAAD